MTLPIPEKAAEALNQSEQKMKSFRKSIMSLLFEYQDLEACIESSHKCFQENLQVQESVPQNLVELESLRKSIEQKEREFNLLQQNQINEMESREQKLGVALKEIELREKQVEEQKKEFNLLQETEMKEMEMRKEKMGLVLKEIELREKKVEEQEKELESREQKLGFVLKEIEQREKKVDEEEKNVNLFQESQVEEKLKEIELREKNLEQQKKEFQLLQVNQIREMEIRKGRLGFDLKEFALRKNRVEEQEKGFQSFKANEIREMEARKEQLNMVVTGIDLREKKVEEEEKSIKLEKKQLENEKLLMAKKEMHLKQCYESVEISTKDIKSRENEVMEQVRKIEWKEKNLETKEKQLELKENKLASRETQIYLASSAYQNHGEPSVRRTNIGEETRNPVAKYQNPFLLQPSLQSRLCTKPQMNGLKTKAIHDTVLPSVQNYQPHHLKYPYKDQLDILVAGKSLRTVSSDKDHSNLLLAKQSHMIGISGSRDNGIGMASSDNNCQAFMGNLKRKFDSIETESNCTTAGLKFQDKKRNKENKSRNHLNNEDIEDLSSD